MEIVRYGLNGRVERITFKLRCSDDAVWPTSKGASRCAIYGIGKARQSSCV